MDYVECSFLIAHKPTEVLTLRLHKQAGVHHALAFLETLTGYPRHMLVVNKGRVIPTYSPVESCLPRSHLLCGDQLDSVNACVQDDESSVDLTLSDSGDDLLDSVHSQSQAYAQSMQNTSTMMNMMHNIAARVGAATLMPADWRALPTPPLSPIGTSISGEDRTHDPEPELNAESPVPTRFEPSPSPSVIIQAFEQASARSQARHDEESRPQRALAPFRSTR